MILWLVIAGLFASNFATADSIDPVPGNTPQSKLPENNNSNATPDNNPANESKQVSSTDTPVAEKPAGAFPHLERALIIVTIVNLLVIIGGLATYLLKRRMQQFLPVSMARMNQER